MIDLTRETNPAEAAHDDVEVVPAIAARPERASQSPSWSRVARRAVAATLAALLAFFVYAFSLSSLAHARAQVGLERRFRAELTNVDAPIGGAIPLGAPVAILAIPRLHLQQVVVEGSRSGQLRSGPGHVVGTPLPGQPGNAVVAGRRAFFGGPFRRIGSLQRGDEIDVTTGQGHATFAVAAVSHDGAQDGAVVADEGDNRLTLFTSGSLLGANERLVVVAKLHGTPFQPTALRHTLDPEGLGLTGERGAIATVLVWLEILAVLAFAAVYARSRWSRVATWVVFAPSLALVTWLFFENAVRLLPATL